MLSKVTDKQFTAGVPNNVGDRYYSQDMIRDFWFTMDAVGLLLSDYRGLAKSIISGWIPNTSGANTDCINIPAGVGYAPFDVTVPTTPWVVPPTTTTETLTMIRVASSLVNNFSLITSGANGNGSTVNYVKIKFAFSQADTRTRVKKAGSYGYAQAPSYTITCDSTAPTSKEICLGTLKWNSSTHVITLSGASRTTTGSALRTATVTVAPNGYTGGGSDYICPGDDDGAFINTTVLADSRLSSGGTIIFLEGTYKIGTQLNITSNLTIRGQGAATIFQRTASSVVQVINIATGQSNISFYDFQIDGNGGTYTAATMYGINQFSNTLVNINYSNILITNNKATSTIAAGFFNCTNLVNCTSTSYATTASGSAIGCGYDNCVNLTNCFGTGYAAESTPGGYGFYQCTNLVNCNGTGTGNTTNYIGFGFYSCTTLTSCTGTGFSAGSGNNPAGFAQCVNLANCIGIGTAVSGTGSAYGFLTCSHISLCSGSASGPGSPLGFKGCHTDKGTAVAMTWSGAIAGDTSTFGWNTGTAA